MTDLKQKKKQVMAGEVGTLGKELDLNTQEIKRTLFNWTITDPKHTSHKRLKECFLIGQNGTKHGICLGTPFSSYVQHKNGKTNN